jgi:anti-anti-sigma factor
MSLFDLQTSNEPYGFRAALSGEIDLSTIEEVESGLRNAIDGKNGVVALDLREVSFLDSSGLRLLLRLHKDFDEAGRRLVVVQGPRRVARVFELTGAEDQLEIVADPAEIAP